MDRSFALFDTALGRCGIAWSEAGLLGMQLPEKTHADTQRRLLSRAKGAEPAAPPPWVKTAMEQISSHLAGRVQDLRNLPLDLSQTPPFHRRVYEALRRIESGQTRSYAELARLAGSPKAARAVGQAMAQNPLPIIVPCHRVLSENGLGGFSAHGGLATKARLLKLESKRATSPSLFAGRGRLAFDPAEAVDTLSRKDRKLATLIGKVGPFALRAERGQTPFEALAQSVVYQQLAGKAASRIFGRLCALYPDGLNPRGILDRPVEDLRGVGLSRSKAASLRDLAQKTLDGTVPSTGQIRKISDDALIDSLTGIRGIGRWTVEMMLIFHLGRPDVLPSTDYGVRKGFALTYRREMPTPGVLEEFGMRWRPFRTVASWYFWRALELDRPA